MRRFYQAIVDIIRGGVHPREVALAVSLGLLAGFVSGWNLCLAVVLLFVLILNVPTKVFGEAWAFGWAASWSLTPVSFALGRWLLENSPLGSLLAPWREHPLLVMFDLDRYTMLGGVAVAVMLMFPAAWLAARITLLLQSKFLEIQSALQAKAPWHGSLLVRLCCWMIFGGAARPVPAPAVNPDWIRRRGMLLALFVFVPAGALAYCFGPGLTTRGLLTALSTANQSEVNAGHMQLSFTNGVLEIEDLQVSDPDHPDRDRLRIGYVAAQLRSGPLLRGRVHVDRLMLENIETDVARRRRARPYGVHLPNLDGTALKDLVPNVKLESPDAINLEEHLSNWETVRERLARLEDLLARIHQMSAPAASEEEFDPAAEAPASYVAMRQARHSFGRATPRFWIEVAALKGLATSFGLGSQGSIEVANVSSQPALTGQPTIVAIKAPQQRAEIVATLNLHEPEAAHELKFHANDLDLAGLVQPYSSRTPLNLRGGTISLVAHGSITAKELDLVVNAQLEDLHLQVAGQRAVAGLPPQLWNDGLAQLRGLQTEATLCGRWSKPQLHIDSDKLVQQFQQQLLAAGETVLAKAIDEQIARGEARVGQALANAEAAVDRQAAKVDAALDRTAERVEQTLDRATAKADEVVAKGEAQVTGVQQRVEQGAAGVQSTLDRTQEQMTKSQDRYAQSAAQAQQTAQQWQNQLNAASRMMQENVAASALTSLGPGAPEGASAQSVVPQAVPSPLPPVEPPAEDIRRRGPPPLAYGEVVGAAIPEQAAPMAAAPSQPIAETAPPQTAAPPADGMRYPESVRNFAQQGTSTVGPRYEAIANAAPAMPVAPAVPAAPETVSANRPASFNGPPPSMELGYEARRPATPPAAAPAISNTTTTTAGAAASSRPVERKSSTGGSVNMMGRMPASKSPASANAASGSEAAEKPQGVTARIGNWSRGMTGKVKGMWSRDAAEAKVSDAGAAAEKTHPPKAAETASAPQRDGAPADAPWYRRMWR